MMKKILFLNIDDITKALKNLIESLYSIGAHKRQPFIANAYGRSNKLSVVYKITLLLIRRIES